MSKFKDFIKKITPGTQEETVFNANRVGKPVPQNGIQEIMGLDSIGLNTDASRSNAADKRNAERERRLGGVLTYDEKGRLVTSGGEHKG